jgi:hypothetical protein
MTEPYQGISALTFKPLKELLPFFDTGENALTQIMH